MTRAGRRVAVDAHGWRYLDAEGREASDASDASVVVPTSSAARSKFRRGCRPRALVRFASNSSSVALPLLVGERSRCPNSQGTARLEKRASSA